ncbi:MAG: Fur family transcriptional regulator [Bacillota bacterium]|nr:Fur family transcriptional regulator [Bacillota bacterium]
MRRAAGTEQDILRSAALRVTPQRVSILRLLRGSKAHPSPEMVYRELKPAYPGLSLNTVYQTLHSLEDAGVLRRISMEDNVYRYDANVAPHVHLVCRGCGRVDDCDGDLDALLGELGERVAARSAWDIRAQDSCFYGYCPACRREEGKPPQTGEEV